MWNKERNLPPRCRHNTAGEYDGVRECYSCDNTVHKEADFSEWTISESGTGREIAYELICGVEVPKLLISVARGEDLCIDLDSVDREGYI